MIIQKYFFRSGRRVTCDEHWNTTGFWILNMNFTRLTFTLSTSFRLCARPSGYSQNHLLLTAVESNISRDFEEAIQLALGTSVVLLRCTNNNVRMVHPMFPSISKTRDCDITFTVLMRRTSKLAKLSTIVHEVAGAKLYCVGKWLSPF